MESNTVVMAWGLISRSLLPRDALDKLNKDGLSEEWNSMGRCDIDGYVPTMTRSHFYSSVIAPRHQLNVIKLI